MLYVVFIAMTAWGALALVGSALLFHLDARQQHLVIPGLPAIGAMVGVVVLHWPATVLNGTWSLVVGVAVLVAIAAVGWHRGGRLSLRAKSVAPLGLAFALGVVPASVALLPVLELGRPVLVQPTLNNDAFAYVSLASWLRSNPALDLPDRARDAPTFGYARVHLESGLRIGEELLQNGVSVLHDRDVASTWYPTLGAWVLMMPGAYWAAGRILGLRPTASALGGFAAAASAALIGQVYQQNSAAVLGVVMAPIALSLFSDAVADEPTMPRWFSPMAMAGLAGTYTEYLPVLAPGLVLFVLARRPRTIPSVVGRAAQLGALALVLSPFIWRNVSRSLLFEAGITAPGFTSSFIHAPAWAILNRITGAAHLEGGLLRSKFGALLTVVLLTGAVALTRCRSRRILLTFSMGAVAVILFLTFIHRFPYGQQRAVQITLPVLVLAVAAGYDRLAEDARRLWEERRRVLAVAVGGVVAIAAVSFPLVNLRSSIQWQSGFQLEGRHIDKSLSEGAAWLRALGGRRGENVMVLSSNFFEQLWMTYLLRNQPGVAWPFLYPDYMNVDRYERWDGHLRRFALVSRDDYADADPATVIRQNSRFRLLDLSRGEALLVVPVANWSSGEQTPGGVAHWMSDSGQLMLLRTPGAPAKVRLRGAALSDLDPLPLEVATTAGETLDRVVLGAAPAEVSIVVPDRPSTVLVLHNRKAARSPSAVVDPRKLSYYLMGVVRG